MPWLAADGSPFLPLLFAVGFLWFCLGVGRRLLIVMGRPAEGTLAERGVIAVGLGSGALQYVAFGLGAVGALGIRSLRIATGVLVVAAARDMAAVAVAGWRGIRQRGRVSPWVSAWIAALLPALLVAALLALAPTTDPDGLAYHLTVPKRWLEEGALGYLPTYPYSNAPMGAEMLFAMALVFAGDVAAKCVHFTLGTVGIIGLYLAGKRLRSPMVGAVASTLYLVGPAGVCILLGWAYVDGVAAFAMIAASLSWIIWYQTGERGVLRGAALLAGFAVCFKITSALLPAALLALTCIAAIARARALGQRRIRAVDALAFSARLLPLMLLPLVPWLTRSAIVTDNPFFPLFARWIPSRDFSPDLSVKFDRFNRFMTWGNAFGRGWTIEQRTWILFGACAAVVLVCSVVMVRTVSLMGRGTIAVVMVALVMQLLAAGLYVRYSVPLAAVLTLPVAAAFGSVLSRRSAPYVWLAVTLVCSLVQARRCLSQENLRLSDVPDLLRTATGLEARRTFLRDHLALYPLYEEVNRDLPKSARVMLSCYCGGFYIDRTTFCADMVQDSLRVTGWDEFTSDLRRLGITHVIAPTALANGGPSPALDLNSNSSITRESQYRVLRPLLSAHATARGIAFDQGLYEIDPALLEAPVQ